MLHRASDLDKFLGGSESLKQRRFGRPSHILKDNIKVNPKEVGCYGVGRSHLIQNRVQWWALVDMITNLWVL